MTVERIPITDRESWLELRRQRFERKLVPEPNSGCWLWTGATVPDGYGSFYWGANGKWSLKAHRAAWVLYRGPIPVNMHVLHACDNRSCVNPGHLYLGDNDANVADRVRKGRSGWTAGSSHPTAKIDEHMVEAILADPRKHQDIATDYEISTGPVQQIKAGRGWRHITNSRTDRRGPLRGSRVGNSKLAEADVHAILSDQRSQKKIAADYGVCQMTISLIKQRKGWRHVR
jgi:hypothetical protein